MLPFRVKVDLGGIAINACSGFPNAPALQVPRHQIVLYHIQGTCCGWGLIRLLRCSRCFLQPQPIEDTRCRSLTRLKRCNQCILQPQPIGPESMRDKENYKYLGKEEAATSKQIPIKEKVKKYVRRTRKILYIKLCERNLIKEISIWPVSLVRHSGLFLKWTTEEQRHMDQRTKKIDLCSRDGIHYMCQEKKERNLPHWQLSICNCNIPVIYGYAKCTYNVHDHIENT